MYTIMLNNNTTQLHQHLTLTDAIIAAEEYWANHGDTPTTLIDEVVNHLLPQTDYN